MGRSAGAEGGLQMIKQRVFISGALMLVAIVLIIGYETGYKPRSEKKREESSQSYGNFDVKKVKRIEITRGEKKDILAGVANGWVVETEANYPADSEAVDRALKAAKKLSCGSEVASGDDQLSRFELEKGKAMEVRLLDDKSQPLADFFVGKRGTTYSSSYFRKAEDKKVCLAYENLTALFDRTNDTWRDKNIFNFNAADCKTLKIEDGATVVWLDKNASDNKWVMLEAQNKIPAGSWTVDGICQTLAKLKTEAFPNLSLAQAGLEKPTKKITVKLTGGNSFELQVGLQIKEKQAYYVKRADQPNIFQLSLYQVQNLFKKKEELTEKTMEGQALPPPEQATPNLPPQAPPEEAPAPKP
jgi:hypothetical protein